MQLKKIVDFLDRELDVSSIDDKSHNGLQVESDRSIKKVGFAVDASMDTFRKAKSEGCDLVIVHHGLFWSQKETLTGVLYKRVKFLIENKIALYTAHLPLDVHKKYGNNVCLFRLLGAKPKLDEPFGGFGYQGSFKSPKSLNSIVKVLNDKLGADCQILKYGKDKIKTLAIVSGDGEFKAFEAVAKDVDLFISGEIGHAIYTHVKEAGINVIGAGHYATEILGVKSLMPVLRKRFKVKTVFLDTPTGL